MTTAAELRKQADALEAAEKDAAVRARCRFRGWEWGPAGLCYALYSEFVPCRGYNGYAHFSSYRDDYGSHQSCRGCRGSNQNYVTHKLRRPKYDAPHPPKEDT